MWSFPTDTSYILGSNPVSYKNHERYFSNEDDALEFVAELREASDTLRMQIYPSWDVLDIV